METTSNKQKAKEIATRWKAKGLPYNAIYDTALEVKDVDLEKEINEWLLRGSITDTRYDDYCDDDIIETAKHFFELGLKAKGE